MSLPGSRRVRSAIHVAALAVLLIAGLATLAPPQASAGTYTDNSPGMGQRRYQEQFTETVVGNPPSCNAACGSWYTFASAGTGIADASASTPAGMTGNVLRIRDSSAAYSPQFSMTADGMDLCSAAQSLEYDLFVPDLSNGATSTILEARVQVAAATTSSSPANSVGVRFTGTASAATVDVLLFVHPNAGAETVTASLGTFAAGATVHVKFAGGTCAPTACFDITVSTVAGGSPQTICATGGTPSVVGDMDEVAFAVTTLPFGTTEYVDNIDWKGAAIPPRTVGGINQDNNYGSYANGAGLVVLAHTVDASNTLVIEKSTDSGATFTSQATGQTLVHGAGFTATPVTAADATHIMAVQCGNTLAVVRTTDGATYTKVNLPVSIGTRDPNVKGCSISHNSGTWVVASWQCSSNAPNNGCGFGNGATDSRQVNVQVVKSTDNGATWTVAGTPNNYQAPNGGGGDVVGPATTAIIQTSATAWTVYWTGCTSSGTSGNCGGVPIQYKSTTNSGSTYSTVATIDDAFSPLGTPGFYMTAAADGTGFAFRISSGQRYVAIPYPGNQWQVVQVDSSTAPLGTVGNIYACTSGHFYGLFQGPTGTDKQRSYDVTSATTTLGSITGTTATLSVLTTSYRIGNDVHVIIPTGAGAMALYDLLNTCVAPVVGGGSGISASATATVTGLVGFDVDPSGLTAIARTDFGEWVRVYPAGTLLSPATKDTDCLTGVLFGGVATMGNHVAYFDCDEDANVVQVEIRSPSLGSPTKPSLCNDAAFCLSDIPTEDCGVDCGEVIAGDQDDDERLAIIKSLPIDYSRNTNGVADGDAVYVGMAFVDTTGKLGVWTYTMSNNGVDRSNIASVGIANQAPDQLCAHQDPDRTTYLYGSSYTSNVQGFRVNLVFQGSASLHTAEVVPTMTNIFPGTAQTAGPDGVACGDSRFAIIKSNGALTVWNRTAPSGTSSAPHITVDLTGQTVPIRGVAMSSDGNWVAYVAGSNWYVISAQAAGATLCTGALPTGTFQDMRMHGSGSTLWIATDVRIANFDIHECTTGQDVVFNDCEDPEDVDCDGVANEDDVDIDGDGLTNDEDLDDDGDGIADTLDNNPSGGGVNPASGGGTLVSCRFCFSHSNLSNAFGIIIGLTVVGGATGAVMQKRLGFLTGLLAAAGGAWGLIYSFQKGLFGTGELLLIIFLLVGGGLAAWWFGGRR